MPTTRSSASVLAAAALSARSYQTALPQAAAAALIVRSRTSRLPLPAPRQQQREWDLEGLAYQAARQALALNSPVTQAARRGSMQALTPATVPIILNALRQVAAAVK
jgi:hypothetical protein